MPIHTLIKIPPSLQSTTTRHNDSDDNTRASLLSPLQFNTVKGAPKADKHKDAFVACFNLANGQTYVPCRAALNKTNPPPQLFSPLPSSMTQPKPTTTPFASATATAPPSTRGTPTSRSLTWSSTWRAASPTSLVRAARDIWDLRLLQTLIPHAHPCSQSLPPIHTRHTGVTNSMAVTIDEETLPLPSDNGFGMGSPVAFLVKVKTNTCETFLSYHI